MKAYITKYALTNGIIEVDDAASCRSGDSILVKSIGDLAYFNTGEWHDTRDAAVVKALEMQALRLRSLIEQMVRVSNITFE